MDELQQINEIVSNAVKDSSYVTVLISSGVYIAYTLIVKIVDLFKAKNRNKPIIEMVEAIHKVSENVVKLNSVLDRTFLDAEQKEKNKIKNVIELAFNAFRVNVVRFCNSTIIHNDIDLNKEMIRQNLIKLVTTEYYNLYNVFSAYEINDVNLSTKLKEEWIDIIATECLSIIYNGQENIVRIGQIDNRLEIILDEYSIFVNNKVFNH